jgi:hypothetical protein
MLIGRALGAAALAVVAVAGLSGCADDPKDKAFPFLSGDDIKRPSGLPSLPGPSLSPDGSAPSPSSSSSYGGSSAGPSSSPSGAATYNPSALSEAIGANCTYLRSQSRLRYDVRIQNPSTEQAFTYSVSVTFRVGRYANSTVASRTVGVPSQTVTVAPGGSRTVTLNHSYSTSQGLRYSCQVTSARKYPAR